MKYAITTQILFLICVIVSFIQCGPTIPPASYGEIRYVYYSYSDMYARTGGSVIETGFMALYTDMQNQKLFLNCSAYDTIAPSANSVLNSTLFYQNSAPTYQVSNHQCYVSGNAYGDFYWWIENSQFVKNLPCPFYDIGTTCSLYSYKWESTSYSVILTSNNYIQQLNITDYYEGRDAEFELGYMAMDFHSFQPYISGNPYVEPQVCETDQSNTFFCPPPSPKITQSIYYLHEYDDSTINANCGDLLGYSAFLCWRSSVGEDLILTQAVVEMDPSWGQYSTCYSETNCYGGNAKSVGRECPYGFLYEQGQCANLTSFGQWFSIRNDARCPLFSPVGTNGCSWHYKYTVKSISFQCLINQGFFDSCSQDGQIPFDNAAAAVNHAFLYCPSVSTNIDNDITNENKDKFVTKTKIQDHLDSSSFPVRILKRFENNF